MDEFTSFPELLQSLIPEASWSRVFAALRQDRGLWERLQSAEFAQSAAQTLGKDPDHWTPTALALLVLGEPMASRGFSLKPEMVTPAIKAYETFTQPVEKIQKEAPDLSTAALVALAVWEDRRSSGAWDKLTNGINPYLEAGGDLVERWGLITAIIFGLINDPQDLLGKLVVPGAPLACYALAEHALFAQPLPADSHRQILGALLPGLPRVDAARLLHQLRRQHPGIAVHLAAQFAQVETKGKSIPPAIESRDDFNLVPQYLTIAELNDLAHQPSQAAQARSTAYQRLRRLLADLARQIADSTVQGGDVNSAAELWSEIQPQTEATPPVSLVFSLIDAGKVDEALSLFPNQKSTQRPALQSIAQVYLAAREGDIKGARRAAIGALKHIQEIVAQYTSSAPIEPFIQSEIVAMLNRLVRLLLDLGAPGEAAQAAQLVSHLAPTPEALMIKAQADRQAGDTVRALQSARLAVALKPESAELRREYANAIEANGDYQAALTEREILLEPRFSAAETNSCTNDDLRQLACTALLAGQNAKAIETCQNSLDINPDDGLTQAVLGEAFLAAGQPEQALQNLRQATQFAPHEAGPWIGLAHAQQKSGQVPQSIETLRSASHAVQDNPAIYFELAKAYLAENTLTQAQSALRRAYELIQTAGPSLYQRWLESKSLAGATPAGWDRSLRCQIARLYGLILRKLGHLTQSRQVLETTYQAYPTYPGLAYTYAQTLLDSGETRLALAPLAAAVASQPTQPDVYLDYAKTLLALGEQPESAVAALQTALERIGPLPSIAQVEPAEDPAAGKTGLPAANNALTQAGQSIDDYEEKLAPHVPLAEAHLTTMVLLAEALHANGDLEGALRVYTQTIESGEAKDSEWNKRLSIGMGRAALSKGQPEIAIAVLQDYQRDGLQDVQVARTLAEAYAAIRLSDEALNMARTAIHLAPDDVGTLAWFADLAVNLDAKSEAISALSRASELTPQRTDLLLKLGEIYARTGEQGAAQGIYTRLLRNPDAQPEHLVAAATSLRGMGDTRTAIRCYERAIELSGEPSPVWQTELASAYRTIGKLDLALEAVDHAMRMVEADPKLHLLKSEILLEMDRPQAAQACLEHALNLHPADPAIHQHMAKLQREQGLLLEALDHARRAASAFLAGETRPEAIIAWGLAADIAHATLQDEITREYLSLPGAIDPERYTILSSAELDDIGNFFSLAAEVALERQEEEAATTAYNFAVRLNEARPRVQALQARLAALRGDKRDASLSLLAAKQAFSSPTQTDRTSISAHPVLVFAVAQALADLGDWDSALDLARQGVQAAPKEPFSHLKLAQLLTCQAETQRLCQALSVVTHAPGAQALAPQVFEQIDTALKTALDLLPEDLHFGAMETIQRWQRRAQAVFQPKQIHSPNSPEHLNRPDDQAAWLATLSQGSDLSELHRYYQALKSSNGKPTINHRIQAEYALALSRMSLNSADLELASNAAHAAATQRPEQPIYQALQAQVAHQAGDGATAARAIHSAISLWPDEPRWQALAGQIAQHNGDYPAAVAYYQQAIALEPRFLSHYIDLGAAHLQAGYPALAIQTLDQAVKIAPNQMEPYLALAKAQFSSQILDQAAQNAENAINLEPNQVAPHLLRGEIAMAVGDARTAKLRADAVLRIDPDHPEALHLLARALQRLGRNNEALEVVEKALPKATNPLPLLLVRAELVSQVKGPGSYLTALESLADQYPDQASVLAPLAKALAENGRRETAIRVAQRALQTSDGELPQAEKAALHFLLGRLLHQAGQLDQSIHQLGEANKLMPNHLEAALELGSTYQERRQPHLALETYQKAISIAPGDPRAYLLAAQAYKANRDYPAAESMLRRAAELSPEDIAIHRQLAGLVALNLVHSRRITTNEG